MPLSCMLVCAGRVTAHPPLPVMPLYRHASCCRPQGVIPSQPDAFVWLGDFFYGDEPAFECSTAYIHSAQCQCTSNYYRQEPYSCMAGDLDNIRDKMMAQVCGGGCGVWCVGDGVVCVACVMM